MTTVNMVKIERDNYNLVNCIGNLDYYNKKCQKCRYAFQCMLIKREIENNPDFTDRERRI